MSNGNGFVLSTVPTVICKGVMTVSVVNITAYLYR